MREGNESKEMGEGKGRGGNEREISQRRGCKKGKLQEEIREGINQRRGCEKGKVREEMSEGEERGKKEIRER